MEQPFLSDDQFACRSRMVCWSRIEALRSDGRLYPLGAEEGEPQTTTSTPDVEVLRTSIANNIHMILCPKRKKGLQGTRHLAALSNLTG